jgi:hypothetical protein
MPVQLIAERESLSWLDQDETTLRTPSVMDATGGARSAQRASDKGQMVKVADQMADLAFWNGFNVSPAISDYLLPTPTLAHLRNHDEPVEDYLQRRQDFVEGRTKGMPGASLGVAVRMETELLGTPRANAANSSAKQVESDAPKGRIEDQVLMTNWGKFEPAIRRWEDLTRPAPAPTKPDGKDGNHRLSSAFTEWMMGLPDGWVTGHGLKRNDELKMCGNGVVPQQAELALRYLLQDVELEKATSES